MQADTVQPKGIVMRIEMVMVALVLLGCAHLKSPEERPRTKSVCPGTESSKIERSDPRMQEEQQELLSRLKKSSESDNELTRELGIDKLNLLLDITRRSKTGESLVIVDALIYCNGSDLRTRITLQETRKGCLPQGLGFEFDKEPKAPRELSWSGWVGPLFCLEPA